MIGALIAALASIGAVVAAWLHGRSVGRSTAATEAEIRRAAAEAAIARRDAEARAERDAQLAEIERRVADPARPTRAEVNAALEREEAAGG